MLCMGILPPAGAWDSATSCFVGMGTAAVVVAVVVVVTSAPFVVSVAGMFWMTIATSWGSVLQNLLWIRIGVISVGAGRGRGTGWLW